MRPVICELVKVNDYVFCTLGEIAVQNQRIDDTGDTVIESNHKGSKK